MLPNVHLHLFDRFVPLNSNYTNKFITVKNEVSRLAKKIFSYLSQYQYPVTVAVCSSLFLQAGIASGSMISSEFSLFPESINNLDTCSNLFCTYANMTVPGHEFFSTEKCYDRDSADSLHFSSLQMCEYHLKLLYSSYVNANWSPFCLSKSNVEVSKINKNMLICFKELCSKDNRIHFMDKNALDWCYLTELKHLRKNLTQLVSDIDSDKTEGWTIQDLLQASIDLFFSMNRDVQSMIASILSMERLQNLDSGMMKNLDRIKKATKKTFLSSILMIKDFVYDNSTYNLSTKTKGSLIEIVEKMEETLSTLN